MTTASAPTIWPIALIASQVTSQFVPNHSAFRKRNRFGLPPYEAARTLGVPQPHFFQLVGGNRLRIETTFQIPVRDCFSSQFMARPSERDELRFHEIQLFRELCLIVSV